MTFAILLRVHPQFGASLARRGWWLDAVASSTAALRRAAWVGGLVLAALLGAPVVAFAQSASETALANGHDALALFNDGKHAEALELFAKAEAQYHTPVFMLYMARCQRELGQLLEARATFATVIAEDVAADAPPPWHKAREEASLESAQVTALIPKLVVTIEHDEGVTLTIDGQPHEVGIGVELNPGPHEVWLRRGTAETRRTVDLAPGQTKEIILSVEVPQVEPVPPAPLPPGPRRPLELPAPDPPTTGSSSNGLRVAGYLLSGLGILGVAAGVITGVMALSASDAAGEGCEVTCPAENKSDEDRAFTLAHASTGSFVAGGAVLGVGIVLIIVSLGADDPVLGTPLFTTPQGIGLRF